ncbi:MAG: trypsin-like peptidase domain-containing protein [Burkholderiales bacterium]
MTHFLGPVVADNRTLNQSAGIDLVPRAGSLGGPRFVILHFDNVALSRAARLTVNLGYGTDVFNTSSGSSFWSRPVDTAVGPIAIRITGGTGSARLREFGAGEPSVTPGNAPGTSVGSQSNCDPFLHTNPYQEPIFETRLMCNPGFAWRNAACALPTIPTAVKDRVAAATGIIVEVHDGHVSSCSGTLIGADLFLTARHCLTDPSGEDVRSASVTFDYSTNCDGTRPAGHAARFFKVLGEVVSGSPPTGVLPPVANDWVVVRLDAAPGALPAPLAMRDAALMVGETIFTMHHPNGAAKKTQAGVHDGGSISGFDYAGGSSGSALFDINGQLVGGPLSSGSGCFVNYAPIAPVKAALVNPPAPPTPKDVMIVFDRSGSMTSTAPPVGRTKLNEAQDAAALFVQLVREGQGDRLGLVTFSSTASIDRSLGLAATVKPLLVGPPPFITGQIGAISAGGATSIGAGVGVALLGFGSSVGNARAVLLLTDGLQNTLPMIEEIEPFLGTTQLCVIGFGSDADIDGPLLSRIARQHGGDFTRAVDGMALRKFFGHCFGNIFEAGALNDPEFVLGAAQQESAPHPFSVCGEERITVVLGWDHPSTPLRIHLRTPTGKLINIKSAEEKRGQTWAFVRVALPHQGERDGTWTVVVDRVPIIGAAPLAAGDVRYFLLVLAAGGPKLSYLGGQRRVYSGDVIDPRVGLHYANGTSPHAEVELFIDAPSVALGRLVTEAGLRAPSPSADAVGAFHSTLQAIARAAGGTLPVATSNRRVPLFDDGSHDDGAMEPDGVYNNPLKDLTQVEGTYHFRAVATYGEGCVATREVAWSIHVEPGIDPNRSVVTVIDVTSGTGVRHGTLVIIPRDRFDNPLGPGRGDSFTVSPLPGVTLDGRVKDRGDGRYTVGVIWDPTITPTPGVIVQQPDRTPVVMAPPGTSVPPGGGRDCTEAAQSLLDCLGLSNPDVACVRVKSVNIEVELKDSKCAKDGDCKK